MPTRLSVRPAKSGESRLARFGEIGWKGVAFAGGYALYLAFSYTVFHSFTLFAAADALDPMSQTLFLVAVLIARVITFCISAALAMREVVPRPFTGALIACVLALCGFMTCGMALQFLGDVGFARVLPWLLFGGVCLGAGDSLATLLWARFCKTLQLRMVYLYILVSNLLSLVLYFGMINVPSWGMVPVTAMVFLISCLFSKLSLDARPPLESELSLPVLRGTVSRMWRPVFGTSVFCFMSGLMMQISGQQQLPLATVQQTSILSSAAVVAVLLVPVLVVKRALHMERLFKLALPLSAAGFLLLPILWNAAGGIVNAFAQLGSMVAGLILWCLLADVARDTQLPSALVFSAALACIDAAQLFGVLVGFVFADNLTQDSIALATIALVSLYLLSMLSLFVFKDREGDFDEIDSEGRPLGQKTSLLGDGVLADERRRACRVNEAADEFALTAREKEVLSLLAQGRTVRGISERLYVSENTVKYHIKSIYQKMGVHTRSELIDQLDKS